MLCFPRASKMPTDTATVSSWSYLLNPINTILQLWVILQICILCMHGVPMDSLEEQWAHALLVAGGVSLEVGVKILQRVAYLLRRQMPTTNMNLEGTLSYLEYWELDTQAVFEC